MYFLSLQSNGVFDISDHSISALARSESHGPLAWISSGEKQRRGFVCFCCLFAASGMTDPCLSCSSQMGPLTTPAGSPRQPRAAALAPPPRPRGAPTDRATPAGGATGLRSCASCFSSLLLAVVCPFVSTLTPAQFPLSVKQVSYVVCMFKTTELSLLHLEKRFNLFITHPLRCHRSPRGRRQRRCHHQLSARLTRRPPARSAAEAPLALEQKLPVPAAPLGKRWKHPGRSLTCTRKCPSPVRTDSRTTAHCSPTQTRAGGEQAKVRESEAAASHGPRPPREAATRLPERSGLGAEQPCRQKEGAGLLVNF